MAAQSICSAKSATVPRVTSARLIGGDVCFDGLGANGKRLSVGIERKRLHPKNSDIISSIRTGRYAGHQLPEMNDLYDDCYLIVEGYGRCGEDGALEALVTNARDTGPNLGGHWMAVTLGNSVIRYTELEHWINTLTRCTKVHVYKSSTPWETAAQILSLYTHYQKPLEDHHGHEQLHVPQTTATIGKASFVRRVAAQLTGIGWDKSAQIDLAFNSVAQMCEAGPGDWSRLKGIGKVLANRIVDQLHGRYSDPGEL
jgi:ERCC4-type nuclease